MAIETRYRQRGGYSNVAPYQYNRAQHSFPPYQRPPTARGRQVGATYAYVAAPRGRPNVATNPPPAPSAGHQQYQRQRTNIYQQIRPAAMSAVKLDNPAALAAIPIALPPPISANTRLPQFEHLYEEFEKMKKNGYVVQPPRAPSTERATLSPFPKSTSSAPTSNSPAPSSGNKDDCFVAAMKIFMQSYMPTACFDCTQPVDDWGKEAQALLNEFVNAGNTNDRVKSSWPDRRASSDCDVSSSSTTDRVYPIPVITMQHKSDVPHGNHYKMDIHRHILEIKPSPYPGGSPTSLPSMGSNHTSDNDADDEAMTSPCNSPGSTRSSNVASSGTIGRRPSYKKKLSREESARVRLSMDSGYQSSSTDGGSVVSGYHGSQAITSGIESDDLSSECSSRPTSPVSNKRRHYDVSDDVGVVSPTEVHPYLHALLEAPWIGRTVSPPPLTPPTLPPPCFLPPPPPASTTSSDSDVSDSYHKHKRWITNEILEMIAVRDRLYKRMKKHPAPDIVDMYKKVRNMVVGMTRNAKRSYEKKIEDSRMARTATAYVHNVAPPYAIHYR